MRSSRPMEEQRNSFLLLRDDFIKLWGQKALELKPPLIPEHYLEFIPGIPIALPKELEGRGGRVVWSEGMFNRLQSKYQEAFNRFIYNSLGVPENSDSRTVAKRLKDFMGELEQAMDRLLPGDPFTRRGSQADSRRPVPVASLTDDVLHSRRDSARGIAALPPAEPDDPGRLQHLAGARGKDGRPGRHHPGQPGREPEVGRWHPVLDPGQRQAGEPGRGGTPADHPRPRRPGRHRATRHDLRPEQAHRPDRDQAARARGWAGTTRSCALSCLSGGIS